MDGTAVTKVVLLACGSFNPITNMHLRMFELARDYLEDSGYQVVKGIISPVGDGYKKKGLIEAVHRLEMARRASENSWITVDSWEGLQPDWVETSKVIRHHHNEVVALQQNNDDVDTVKYGKKRRTEDNYFATSSSSVQNRDGTRVMLLCGADVLESFGIPNLWKQEDIEEIVGRFGLVCITRCGNEPLKFIHQSDILWKHRKNIHIVQEWVTNEISATHVRRALRRGHSVRYLLPDSVLNYIREHCLYSEDSERKNAGVVLAPLQRYSGASTS